MPIVVREGMAIPWTRRFVPDDLGLVKRFLRNKIANQPLPNDAIFEFDVYCTEPWNVPDVYGPGDESYPDAPWLPPGPKKIVKEGYKGYYFVRSSSTTKGKKQKLRTIIKSGDGGYWKKVKRGRRDVRDEWDMLVGFKRIFVFHRYTDEKKDHAEKTDWILNEYSLNSRKPHPWVLCSIRNKLEHSKAYLTDDEDEEFLQEDEPIPKLTNGVEEVNIRNIENASTKQFENADNSDIMEEEEEEEEEETF